jgi:hypothetical protein
LIRWLLIAGWGTMSAATALLLLATATGVVPDTTANIRCYDEQAREMYPGAIRLDGQSTNGQPSFVGYVIGG